jgi:hypothetical protein
MWRRRGDIHWALSPGELVQPLAPDIGLAHLRPLQLHHVEDKGRPVVSLKVRDPQYRIIGVDHNAFCSVHFRTPRYWFDPAAATWSFNFFASSTHNTSGVFSLLPIKIVI